MAKLKDRCFCCFTAAMLVPCSSSKYGKVQNIPEIKGNNEPISSAAEMAEVCNDFLCNNWIKFGK